jgi:hypothetical protein
MSFSRLLYDSNFLKETFPELIQHSLDIFLRYLPIIEKIVFGCIDAIFLPRQILNQLIIAIGIHTALTSLHSGTTLIQYFLDKLTQKGRKKTKIQSDMDNSTTYSEWQYHATLLDNMLGLSKWRKDDNSQLYDASVLKKRIYDIKSMIQRNDVFGLMFRLRGGLARDQYGMLHEGLFNKATAGTKLLVEEYHHTVASALNYICDETQCIDKVYIL